MNVQNHIGFAARPVGKIRVKQYLARRKPLSLPGGSVLWMASLKMSCLVFVVVLAVGTLWGHTTKQLDSSIQEIEAQQHILRNNQMALLAERAVLMSEQHVKREAGRELALFVPGKEQVYKVR